MMTPPDFPPTTRTPEECAENYRQLREVAPTPEERFALMFNPLLEASKDHRPLETWEAEAANEFFENQFEPMNIKLENWAMVFSPHSIYTAPELITQHLVGDVYNHPRHADGSNVTTSAIIGKKGNLIATKSGSCYELGEVKPDYEDSFPNSRERLFQTLPEI